MMNAKQMAAMAASKHAGKNSGGGKMKMAVGRMLRKRGKGLKNS